VLDHGVVYAGSDKSLAALSAQDGKLLWSYAASGPPSVLGIVNGVLYGDTFARVKGTASSVFALNASDGSVRWSYKTQDVFLSRLLADGVIYEGITTHDCQCSTPHTYVLALNTSDGSVKWQTPQDIDNFTPEWTANGLLYGEDSLPDGGVVNILTRHVSDGSIAWQYPGKHQIAPMIGHDNNAIYALFSPPGGLFSVRALNPATGSVLWQTPNLSTTYTSTSLLDGVIYLGAADGSSLLAFDASSSKQLWKVQLGTPSANTNVPAHVWAVVDGTVYLSDPQGFLALNASSGAVKWKTPNNGFPSIVAVEQGVVYGINSDPSGNASSQNVLYALKASDGSGSILWSYDVTQPYTAPVVG
jgi:outer membrane protein assembly factor BamB